jgi:chemotaxis family two-component system response regulator Rcp1
MSVNVSERNIEILVVEDSPSDVRLLQEAFREIELEHCLNVVGNGEEGLAFLKQEGIYQHAPRPDLILLDLNLPRMNGREFLAEIKGSSEFRRIPVVVMTSSGAEEDIIRSYDLHANCFITKPVDLDQFIKIIQSIEQFWLTIVKLP